MRKNADGSVDLYIGPEAPVELDSYAGWKAGFRGFDGPTGDLCALDQGPMSGLSNVGYLLMMRNDGPTCSGDAADVGPPDHRSQTVPFKFTGNRRRDD